MPSIAEHPTVKIVSERKAKPPSPQAPLDPQWLRELCLEAGADDVGFVDIDRPEIANQKSDILSLMPSTHTLVSIVCRMNKENIRVPARSLANLEFHHVGDKTTEVIREVIRKLERLGIRAVNAAAVGFPMEADRWATGKSMWVVSHKPIAVAAGLGKMGIHRNVIHPKFGNFILLGTFLIENPVNSYSQPINYNPCLECKLCVAACPTGAIAPDGRFDFSACLTHNYREFMSGFNDWVDRVVESGSPKEYRKKVSPSETVSMWQSLSFGANYKAAYCLAACPAGEDIIAPFLTNRKEFLDQVVRPLQKKVETVYVVPGSDAEEYVPKHFPHKTVKTVHNGLGYQTSVMGFLRGLSLVFQKGKSKGLEATYHFTFTGKEEYQGTVIIKNQTLQVQEGLQGTPNLHVKADSVTWLKFLRKDANLVWALLRGKIRMKGNPKLLLAFGRCFPN